MGRTPPGFHIVGSVHGQQLTALQHPGILQRLQRNVELTNAAYQLLPNNSISRWLSKSGEHAPCRALLGRLADTSVSLCQVSVKHNQPQVDFRSWCLATLHPVGNHRPTFGPDGLQSTDGGLPLPPLVLLAPV
jgi:hypothetical protein